MHFVYLHGFNSAADPTSDKIQSLMTLGTVDAITYDTFGSYQEISSELLSKIEYTDDLVLVGTSLGGFWAAEIARKLNTPSVIINPCTDPFVMLRKYVDKPHINYKTGKTKILSNDIVDSYENNSLPRKDFQILPLVLLDMGDSVIDSSQTKESLGSFPMICYPGGSHRFDHMGSSLNDIFKYVNRCCYVEQLNV